MDDKFKIGQIIFDHWRIVRLLRTGPMGNLYQLLYQDHGKDYRAMVKVVSLPRNLKDLVMIQDRVQDYGEYFDSVLSFMLEEVEIMSRLGANPYVVNYYDHKVERHSSGLGYDLMIRMEHLVSLWECALEKTLTQDEVLRLGIEMCLALEDCHAKGIIHRNIRPEHIYVTSSGGYKLGDFGVPCVSSKDMTVNGGEQEGDPFAYMAPELYRDEKYDERVDVYSLGLVLYSLLNRGQLPFYPENASKFEREEAIARRMRGEVLPSPIGAKRGKLAKILQRACHFQMLSRYPTVSALRRDLELALQKREEVIIAFPKEKAWDTVETLGKSGPKQFIASWFG